MSAAGHADGRLPAGLVRRALRILSNITLFGVGTLALFAFALWLRVEALGRESLWLDEIFSVSLSANLTLPGTLLAVLHFDVHPPLYYLQLNLWQRFAHSDTWLLLNSVFWSMATLAAVFLGCARAWNARVALIALALCTVLGSDIFFAEELRMYALLSCLTVLSWMAADSLRRDYRFRRAIPLIVMLALLAAVHSAALIPASAIMLYALPDFSAENLRRHLPVWIATGALVGAAFAPWILLAHMHHVEHAGSPSLQALTQTVGGWLVGYESSGIPGWALPVAAGTVVAGLVIAVWSVPALLRLVLCCVAWPLLFGALLCWIVQPIWLDRTFAFCAPFVAIAWASALGQRVFVSREPRSILMRQTVGLLLALWVAGFSWIADRQVERPYKPDHYREAAAYLAMHATAGDVIFAPDDPDFWAVARYLIGPRWGSVLVVEDQADKDRKYRLLNFLENRLHVSLARLQALGLAARTRDLSISGRTLYIGNSPLPPDAHARVLWLVTREGNEPQDLPLCTSPWPAPTSFGRTEIFRMPCDGGGPAGN